MRRCGQGLALIGVVLSLFFPEGRACESGYYDVDGQCYACPANCLDSGCTYTFNLFRRPVSSCTACNAGYLVSEGACRACGENCAQCRKALFAYGGRTEECTQCKAGYTTSGVSASTGSYCRPCAASCGTGNYKYIDCATGYDTGCNACSAGQKVVGGTSCQTCDSGTYVASNRLDCLTCSTCYAPRYIPTGGACNTEHDTVCNDCPNNKASSGSDQATCTTCSSGYFRTQSGTSDFTCTSCTSVSCGTNQWINCAGAVRVCTDCAGSKTSTACNAGYASDKTCDGTSLTGSTCVLCGPGSERLSAGLPLACSKCDTGKYKDAAIVSLGGVRNCAACTNRPANNSVYTVWGMSEPISSNCPWCVLVFVVVVLVWVALT